MRFTKINYIQGEDSDYLKSEVKKYICEVLQMNEEDVNDLVIEKIEREKKGIVRSKKQNILVFITRNN